MNQSASTIETAILPSTATRPAAIACTSFATLLLEIALTRLFSVVLFYHFAFLAISIALLGLGAGGVFAFVRRERLKNIETPALGARAAAMSALAILLALEVVLHTPVSLNLGAGNFARLTAIYLFAAVPFFFTGLLFSTVFAREPHRIGNFYGADLMGGAAACLAVVPLLNLIGGAHAILFSALAMAAARVLGGASGGQRQGALGPVGFFALLLVADLRLRRKPIEIVYAKGARRDQPWVEFAKWNAISRVEVDKQGDAKAIVIDADASTYIMNAEPARWAEQGYQKKL